MIRLSFFAIVFVLVSSLAFSQDYTLTGKQADILKLELAKETADSGKIDKLLKLAWYQVVKPGEAKVDLDSAKNYLSQAGTILKRSPANRNLGFYNFIYSNYYNENGQKKIADALLEKAINYLKTGGDPFLSGSAYAEKMNRIDLSPQTVPAKLYLTRLAADDFSKTTNKRKLGDCMRLMADLRIYLKDDPQALLELDSAKRLYQEAKSGDWQQLYILYSEYYDRQDNNEKHLENVLAALRATDPHDNSAQVARLKFYAELVYFRLKDYKQSINIGLGALAMAKKEKNNEATVYNIALYIIRAYGKLEMPATGFTLLNKLEKEYPENPNELTCRHLLARLANYNDLKQYSDARTYFDMLINQIAEGKITEDNKLSVCYNLMSNYCIDSRQYSTAGNLLHKWDLTCNKLNNPAFLRMLYLDTRVKLDTAKKDFKAAASHLIASKLLIDSIFNTTRTRQLKEMEIQYQVERRENENKLQQQKIINLTGQQLLQHAELVTAGITKNIMLISAVCLLIIAGLVYRQYINGKKTNRIIASKNKRLTRLLHENDFLMKEVHHRVKNNLQIVTSLLNSQSAYLEEGAALDAIMKSKGRVESIALIHQKLYKSESQSSIYMPEYVQELVGYLKESFTDSREFWFDVAVDDIYLDVSDTVPIGLIINESVTNAIKHAFSPIAGNEKVIQITLRKCGPNIVLMVKDNGKGLDMSQLTGMGSFGLLLINGLTKDLAGKISMFNDGGTVIRIVFKPATVSKGLQSVIMAT